MSACSPVDILITKNGNPIERIRHTASTTQIGDGLTASHSFLCEA